MCDFGGMSAMLVAHMQQVLRWASFHDPLVCVAVAPSIARCSATLAITVPFLLKTGTALDAGASFGIKIIARHTYKILRSSAPHLTWQLHVDTKYKHCAENLHARCTHHNHHARLVSRPGHRVATSCPVPRDNGIHGVAIRTESNRPATRRWKEWCNSAEDQRPKHWRQGAIVHMYWWRPRNIILQLHTHIWHQHESALL